MTEFTIELLRLHGDERWEDWGDQWWSHAEMLGELPREGPGGWQLIDHFREQGARGKKLDWGALLYRVTREELIALYSEGTELRPRQGTEPSSIPLSDLAPEDDYGLVVVER